MLITALPSPPDALLASWSEGHLLAVDAKGDCWFDGVAHVRLGVQPSSVKLSPSGELAIARIADGRVLIWDTREHSVRALTARSIDAAFALRTSDEVVAVLEKHELALWSPSGQIVSRQPLGGLAGSSLVPIAGGRAVVVVGQEFAESRDTLVLFDASEVPISNDLIGRRFRFLEGLVDSSNTLAVGPCGLDRVVVFRDPNETEDPLEPGEAPVVPREWGFRGFYVTTRDGNTVARLHTELRPASGSMLVAGESEVAVEIDGQITVLSRHDSSIRRLDLRWASQTGSSVVLGIDADDVLHRLDLA